MFDYQAAPKATRLTVIPAGDVRECMGVDSKAQPKEMKGAADHWTSVAN